MAAANVPYLGQHIVRNALYPINPLLGALEIAFRDFSKGKEGGVVQPVRSMVRIQDHNGIMGVMPAYSKNNGALATKVVTIYPDNKSTPSHQGVVLLFDAKNGSLKSIIDAESLTEIRTAAASAVATKHICKEDPRILAIIGAGTQGKSHWDVFSQIFTFSQVRIYSRTRASCEKLASHIGPVSRVCNTVEEAVKDADVIITATFSKEPILLAKSVKPGAHINAVGACTPDAQEIDPELMRNSVVYVDSKDAALVESGDVILSKAEVYAEIGEVIGGTKDNNRQKTTVFKSLGMAVEDVVTASLIHEMHSTGT